MVKIQKSDFVDNIFYVKENETKNIYRGAAKGDTSRVC